MPSNTNQYKNQQAAGLGRLAVYAAILGIALCLRLVCLAHTPFFCDVPGSVNAVASGIMRIQFPGYVAYHQLALVFSKLTPNLFGGFLLFTVIAGMLSSIFTMKAAGLLGGFGAAMSAGMLSGFGLLDIYFSSTGTSYPADALTSAAILYYGLKTIHGIPSDRDILLAEFWCCVGIAFRPLSALWLLPAVFYLIFQNRNRRLLMKAAALFIGLGLVILAQYSTAYESLADVASTLGSVTDAAQGRDRVRLVTNLFRTLSFPLYFFNLWLIFGMFAAAKAVARGLSTKEKQSAIFLLITTLPYVLVLLKYIPHAGYLCLLGPVFCIFPLIFRIMESSRLPAAVIFTCISLAQLFVLRPVAPSSLLRCVADAYFLQYSKTGIDNTQFTTLAQLTWANGVTTDRIPATRMKEIKAQEIQSRTQAR